MKAKIIIAVWVISMMFMATDNLPQAIIALCVFGFSSWLLKKHEIEATREMKKLDSKIDKLIKKG